MNKELTRNIATGIQIFQSIEQKETFLFSLGALLARVISLKKAAELIDMEPEAFLKILDLMGIEFTYLTQEDVELEKHW